MNDETPSSLKSQNLRLGAQDTDAHRAVSLAEQLLPFLDSVEHEWDELSALELSPTRVNPDDGFCLLGTQEDHVVVRGDDDLIRLLGMSENALVAGTPGRSIVGGMSHVAGVDAERSEGGGDTPRELLVEEEPENGSCRRDATTY